jgi:hypothetical protein
LAGIQLVVAVKDLDSRLLWLGDIHVVDAALAYNTEFLVADPAPEHNFVCDLALLEGRWAARQVEDLKSR